MEGINSSERNNPNTLRPTPFNRTGQPELQNPQFNTPTRPSQNHSTPSTHPIIPHTPSDLAGILSEAAKANAEFWAHQSMATHHVSPSTARMPSSTYTTDLPLLPMPKPLQTVKRGREDVLLHGKAGQCVMVRNLAHAATRGDIQNLFAQYEWTSIRMPARPAGYAIVCLASAEEAARAVGELGGGMIRGSKILVLFEENMIPERDEGVAAKRVKTEEGAEMQGVILGPPEGGRAETEFTVETDILAVKQTTQKVETETRYFLRIGDLPFEVDEKDFGEFLVGINVKALTLPTFRHTTLPTGYAILELPTFGQQKGALQRLSRQKFQGHYLTITRIVTHDNNDEEKDDGDGSGLSVLESPPLPKHVNGSGRSREEMFREAVLCGGGGRGNRRVLREWFWERGWWLDL